MVNETVLVVRHVEFLLPQGKMSGILLSQNGRDTSFSGGEKMESNWNIVKRSSYNVRAGLVNCEVSGGQ